MSKNRDSAKRSPGGIIARLMGMEGMPPQPKLKPQNRSPDNYQQGIDYVDFLRNAASCSRRSSSSREEDQEFKDVFEVVETRGYPLQRNINPKLTEAKKALLFRNKVLDAKCLSTNEALQNSRELNYALEVLDSNKELFLKCLQEPNSLFKKHLHDLHAPLPQSRCRHVAARKTSESRNFGNNDRGYLSDRETTHTTFCRKYYEDSLNRPYHRSAHNSTPTRIVVLKPNLGMAQSVSKSVSSPQSSHSFMPDTRMRTEFQNRKSREPEFRRNKKMSDEEGMMRYKSDESREIGKKITRKLKNSLSATGSSNLSSKFKGYVGDESSCYGSGIDSESESESATLTSRKSFDWNDMHRISPSHSFDPLSVNREAKKRLANRWKMAHGAHEVRLVGSSSSSTLGEMLAITDRDAKAEILDNEICASGISSKEGWKDECIQNLSKSRSLPTCSSAASGSSKASTLRGTHKETINLGRNKPIKKHSNQKEQSMSCSSRSDSRKSKFSMYTDREASDIDQKKHVCKNQIKSSIEFNGSSEQKIMNSESSICDTPERNLAHENMIPSSKSSDLQTHRPACVSIRDDSPSNDLDIPAVKEISNGPSKEGSVMLSSSVGEPESPASSFKEAEQPSPVSVLEAPFSDDRSSGFDCFGSLSADLQELRMQLQLLKLESEEYNEGRMVISSDEEVNEESTKVRTPFRMEESFLDQSSFVEDVLVESGFYNTDPDTLIATCPIDQSVFQKLEKKYSDHSSYSKSEMRLLFDRINAGLFEILRRGIDPHPWIHKQLERKNGAQRSWNYKAVEDDLCKLLAIQENNTHKDALPEKVLGRESEWLDLEEEIDATGREVERLLMDELVLEAMTI